MSIHELIGLISVVMGSNVVLAIVNRIFTKKDRNDESNCCYKQALRLIIKDRLRELCVKYIAQGWIYEDELEDLITMHSMYHDELKGNGFLDTLMGKVKNLEIRGMGVK